jgi:hypothetical protein
MAAGWIVLEHRCCPFLKFTLELTDESEVWLSVTGPDGVKAFLAGAMQRTPDERPRAQWRDSRADK